MSNDKFHRLILPLKNKLYRLALSIVRDRREAEDIVQDVFLKLWSKKDEWEEIENIEAYCFRSTKNLALDRIASIEIRKTESISPELQANFFIDTETPFGQITEQEQINYINKCIEELSENQKMVFQLREVEGMSYKEISESLDISEDLVKVSLFRARNKIKNFLSEYYKR